ncbi:aquaporin-8a.2 [Engraulis encrasicolus]|uniref:aquaporin-8a.2 n=1 Tax=Engraulis encrasicolus TaxID=184585 RepID=UPI002FCEBFE0
MADEKVELRDVDRPLTGEGGKKPQKPLTTFDKFIQPCLGEIIGTTFFVFIGCVSVIENVPAAGRVQPALVHGFAVAIMVAVMDNISGSHFNPPFTIAIYLCGGMQLVMVLPYLASQLAGGLLGAGMAKIMVPSERYMNATGAAFDILKSDEQLVGAICGEIFMTCLVTMVVLLAAVNSKTKSPMAPFLVGCTVIINILAGGDVSGTCLNPARAFGPAVMAGYWQYHWVYWVGPLTGGVLAAALVRLFLGDDKIRVIMK